MRTKVVAGLWMAGFVLGASACVEQVNGAVFATLRFDATKVRADRLTVRVLDASGKDLLPAQDFQKDGGLIVPDDSVRVFFDEARGGAQASLLLLAFTPAQPPYLPEGLVVAAAEVPFTIPAKNKEVLLSVPLDTLNNLACPKDVSGSGCCLEQGATGSFITTSPTTSTRTRTGTGYSLPACGVSGNRCGICNPITTDTCTNGNCTCGVGPACEADQLCERGRCTCSPINCFGCCLNERCVAPAARSATQCGAGAEQCQTCPPNASCGGEGVCVGAAGCSATQCSSGTSCAPITHPRCRTASGACDTCDSLRSDRCKLGGGCACGLGDVCKASEQCERGMLSRCVPQ